MSLRLREECDIHTRIAAHDKRMKARPLFRVIIAGLWLANFSVHGQLITLDPDDYPDGTVLNNVIPGVSLITAGANNLPYPPVSFDVTTRNPGIPYPAPTGDKVFAHAGVPFWNDFRRLRMDFNGLVSTISIDFMGSTPLLGQRGQLAVYSFTGELLEAYTSQPLFGGQVETMAVQRNQADVAWAVAYTLPDGDFGRLDHLVFSQPVPVPEPSTTALLIAGAFILLQFRRRR